jgi:hypothetical protein
MSEIKFKNVHEFKLAIEAGKITTPQFVSIRQYETNQGEIANYLINLGQHYGKSLMADFALLCFLSPEDFDVPSEYESSRPEAYDELYTSMCANVDENKNNHTPASRAQSDLYITITPNIKMHKETGELYLNGFLIRKKVIQPAPPQPPKRSRKKNPVKQAKKFMTSIFKTSKYRTFKVSKITNIKINGNELILEV